MSSPVTPPDRAGLAAFADRLFSGARLLHVRRLRGGISTNVHVVEVALPSGSRERFVLRRPRPTSRFHSTEALEREFRLLGVLASAGVRAPRPLLLDATGEHFGMPALAMTYEGRPYVRPRSVRSWVAQLASALLELQQVTPATHDLSFVTSEGPDFIRDELAGGIDPRLIGDPLAAEIQDALTAGLDAIEWLPHTLSHDDYWPGNTVWRRGKLTAIVDWSPAIVADPRADVAECAVGIALMLGPEASELFGSTYQALRPGGPLPDLWFYHLLRARRSFPNLAEWLPGSHDLGLTHLTVPMQRSWLEEFARPALAAARVLS